jgi:hypothetical protein
MISNSELGRQTIPYRYRILRKSIDTLEISEHAYYRFGLSKFFHFFRIKFGRRMIGYLFLIFDHLCRLSGRSLAASGRSCHCLTQSILEKKTAVNFLNFLLQKHHLLLILIQSRQSICVNIHGLQEQAMFINLTFFTA